MANSAGITNAFKRDVMNGVHDFSGADVYRFALYQTSATISPSTAAYTATGEISGGNYVAKGETLTTVAAALDGTVGHMSPTVDVTWTNVTFTTDCALLYNDTATTPVADPTVASFTFASQTVSSGTFTLQMPATGGTTGLVRIA